MLDARYGRRKVVDVVRAELDPLSPKGGLLDIPKYPWYSIFTTNFDDLLEQAFSAQGIPFVVVSSDFDYGKLDDSAAVPIFKIHGSKERDLVDGYQGRMVLTEEDYDEYRDFREIVFRRFAADVASKDVLMVGQSLADRHLRDEMKEAAQIHRKCHSSRQLYSLLFERDEDRAMLFERRGFAVAFGEIDSLTAALEGTVEVRAQDALLADAEATAGAPSEIHFPLELAKATHFVDPSSRDGSNVRAMFDGSPASFGDIASGYTFSRDFSAELEIAIQEPARVSVAVVGVAGVGKTTVARQTLHRLAARPDSIVFEHRPEYRLDPDAWLAVREKLAAQGLQGYLFIDDCTHEIKHVNMLANRLAKHDDAALKLVLTATLGNWEPRLKSPALFERGLEKKLSRLSRNDIDNLLKLVEHQSSIKGLVERSFANLSRRQKVKQLSKKARADMFVCLKNVFGRDELDMILLREFAALDEEQQKLYQLVAALHAMCGPVHRQLVLRLLDVSGTDIKPLLDSLEGLIEEDVVSERDGIFVWRTRHEVIAQTLSRYKFADPIEKSKLIGDVIANANPLVRLELRNVREMCLSDFGIAGVADPEERAKLLEELVDCLPGERVPHHRLIRTYMDMQDVSGMGYAIERAEAEVGLDRPTNRYKVRRELLKAKVSEGLTETDRTAILGEAERIARVALERFTNDKFTYSTFALVGQRVAEATGDLALLDEAIEELKSAYARLKDPVMVRDIDHYVDVRGRLARRS